MNNWNLDSWKKHVAKHMPNYENIDELDKVENKLASFPPLVFAGEVRSLKSQLKEVSDEEISLVSQGQIYQILKGDYLSSNLLGTTNE